MSWIRMVKIKDNTPHFPSLARFVRIGENGPEGHRYLYTTRVIKGFYDDNSYDRNSLRKLTFHESDHVFDIVEVWVPNE